MKTIQNHSDVADATLANYKRLRIEFAAMNHQKRHLESIVHEQGIQIDELNRRILDLHAKAAQAEQDRYIE